MVEPAQQEHQASYPCKENVSLSRNDNVQQTNAILCLKRAMKASPPRIRQRPGRDCSAAYKRKSQVGILKKAASFKCRISNKGILVQ